MNFHKQLDGFQFKSATIRQKYQLHPLDLMSNSVKVQVKAVLMYQTLPFTKLRAIAQSERGYMKQYFTFQMTAEPPIWAYAKT